MSRKGDRKEETETPNLFHFDSPHSSEDNTSHLYRTKKKKKNVGKTSTINVTQNLGPYEVFYKRLTYLTDVTDDCTF